MEARNDEQVFADNFKARREALGLSQADVAGTVTDLGYPMKQQTIWKIENHKRPILLKEAPVLAQAVNSTMDALLRAPMTKAELRKAIAEAKENVRAADEVLPKMQQQAEDAALTADAAANAVRSTRSLRASLKRRLNDYEARLAEMD